MNAPPPLDLRRDGIAIVLLVLAALAIQLPLYDRWVNLLDEGGIAVIADQINHGKPPYQYGVHLVFPGIFYLTAGEIPRLKNDSFRDRAMGTIKRRRNNARDWRFLELPAVLAKVVPERSRGARRRGAVRLGRSLPLRGPGDRRGH